MIILHAGVAQGHLLVWGETPAESAGQSVKPNARRSKKRQPQSLPYDAGRDRLFEALTAAQPELSLKPEECQSAAVWLPTVKECPAASSPLIAPPPESGAEAVLTAWMVTTLQLRPESSVDLLCACMHKETLASGVIVGKTLAYWATALRFAGALVARQQFLPGLNGTESAHRACWKPIFAGPDSQRLTELARALPPACRAMAANSETPPDAPAATVLNEFLGVMVDGLVRSSVTLAGTTTIITATVRKSRQKAQSFDSVHDHWLHALRTVDGQMKTAVAEVEQFGEQVRDWQRPVTVSTATPFRLCFRLEEPIAEEAQPHDQTEMRGEPDAWYLRYLLQARDDPSLLVPVADAWSTRGRKAAALKSESFNSREYLLSALGQAAGLCPFIEYSLKSSAPAGHELDATAAHSFLTERAWLLEQGGFGVLLPAWWTRKGTKLRLTARAVVHTPAMQGSSGMRLDDILKFEWQVALGDQPLTREELELLARLKAPLVKMRGQWVQLNAEEIQAALDFWKHKDTGQATVREVVRMALGDAKIPGGITFEGVMATGWIEDFLARLEGRSTFEELRQPGRFHGTLRPYQGRGYSWLGFLREAGLGACLADDMGLGKTIQTLALIQRDWESNGKRPVLLICPMSVVGNWQKEAERFTPDLPVLVHHGGQRIKGPAFRKEAETHALVLSSYALLHRDFDILKGVTWAGIVLDEAQNIKNPQTKQAQAARALPADYRIALTGTPVENHVGDLWSIMEFLNPGFLGTQAEFKRRFFWPIQANHDPEATQQLQRLTVPFILRRLKTDKTIIADLPDKLEMKVYCTLTKEQASLYAAVVEEANQALEGAKEGIQRKGLILATLSKLKQVCNHPAQFLGDNSAIPGRSGKLARLTEMLEEVLEEGDRALVFTQFSEMGKLIQRHLQETFGREVLFLHGGTSKKQRDAMVARFQSTSEGRESPDDPRVFLLSLKAGGTGLNLTAANHVFHFDRWWNPAVENQATDRAFRIGQTRRVQVHKYLCVGTLEEKIDEMIERKQEIAKKVVGTGEGWLTELSNEQLKELFTLRNTALGE